MGNSGDSTDHDELKARVLYTEAWTKETTAKLLGSRIGFLQGDGFGGYDQFEHTESKLS